MTARLLLLAARIWTGIVFLKSGWGKVTSGWIANQGILRYLGHANPMAGRGFFEHTVTSHPTLFSYLVVAGELGVGACMVLGFLTRWAGIVGFALMACFAVSASVIVDPAPPIGFAIAFLLLAAADAGKVAGLDRWLDGRAPEWVV